MNTPPTYTPNVLASWNDIHQWGYENHLTWNRTTDIAYDPQHHMSEVEFLRMLSANLLLENVILRNQTVSAAMNNPMSPLIIPPT